MHKTDNQWEFAVWLKELKPGLCDNLGGGGEEREVGGRFQREGAHVYLGWLMLVDGRDQHNIMKQISFN